MRAKLSDVLRAIRADAAREERERLADDPDALIELCRKCIRRHPRGPMGWSDETRLWLVRAALEEGDGQEPTAEAGGLAEGLTQRKS